MKRDLVLVLMLYVQCLQSCLQSPAPTTSLLADVVQLLSNNDAACRGRLLEFASSLQFIIIHVMIASFRNQTDDGLYVYCRITWMLVRWTSAGSVNVQLLANQQ
jgi:hypothetical protein